MKNKGLFYVIAVLAIIFVLSLQQTKKRENINWQHTFSAQDKIPGGCSIFIEILPQMADIPQEKLHMVYGDIHQEGHFRDTTREPALAFIVNSGIYIDSIEYQELWSFAARGNTVFLAASQFGPEIYFPNNKQISIGQTKNQADSNRFSQDTISLSFYGDMAYYKTPNEFLGGFGKIDAPWNSVVYSKDINRHLMIYRKIGNGMLILCAMPQAFTNYQLLQPKGMELIEKMMSFIPVRPKYILWVEQNKHGTGHSPLRYIISRAPLRAALYSSLAFGILYVLMMMRRRQRSIPILPLPENTTGVFVKAVASLHLHSGDHSGIAARSINTFQELLWHQYGIKPGLPQQEFIQSLIQRTGISPEQAHMLVHTLSEARQAGARLTSQSLIKLYNCLNDFYRSTSQNKGNLFYKEL